MKKTPINRMHRILSVIFVLTVFLVLFAFESSAAMDIKEMKSRLSAYSDSFVKEENGVLHMEYPVWDISEEDLYYVISDIAENLMGEPVNDYCKVQIKFFYTDKPYGKDFKTFGDNLFRVKKDIGNFFTEWSRYNTMTITVTSYNRVCDEYSANVTLQFNGSDDSKKGKEYNEKLLSLVSEANETCSDNMEKVQFFLKWLDENAVYNIFTGYTNDPYYALISGNTVCGGYANAFKDLCNACGIPAIVPVNQEINHAWSQVYVNGQWYTADLCDVVKSKSETYEGYLFTDPTVPYDCKSFVEKHRDEYINSLKDGGLINISACQVSYENKLSYTGETVKPDITVRYGNSVLKEGVHYTVTCSAKNPGKARFIIKGVKKNGYKGEKSFAFQITTAALTLSGTAGKNKVELRWNKVYGATGYIISMYDKKSDKFTVLAKVKDTACVVKKLKAGEKYTFSVRSYVLDKGKEHKGKQAKISLYTSPSKVKNLRFTAARQDSITLRWDKIKIADEYEIYMKNSEGKWEKIGTTAKNVFKVKGLEADKKYYFKVRAIGDKGNGVFSAVRGKRTLLPKTQVSLAYDGNGISVSWDIIEGADGYVVAYSPRKDMINSEKISLNGGDSLSAFIETPEKGKKYYVKVKSYKIQNGKRVYSDYSVKKDITAE